VRKFTALFHTQSEASTSCCRILRALVVFAVKEVSLRKMQPNAQQAWLSFGFNPAV
jgi:hypothetical protein